MDTPTAVMIDTEALVTGMVPLVHHVVSDLVGRLPRFVDRDDLVAAGMLGLTQAARSFDPGRGVSFQVYARTRIRGAILDELRGRDWVSRGTRSRANDVRTATTKLEGRLGRTPSEAEVASELDVDVAVVRRTREEVARASELERSGGSLRVQEVADRVAAEDAGPLARILDAELRGYLIDGVMALPERLRHVVIGHFFDGREMRDIASDLGVTASRVSQLCGEAIALLRDGINAQLSENDVAELSAKGRVARRKAAYYRAVADASTVVERLDPHRSVRQAVMARAA